uniref:diguanylate cyclase domain-containing protein n=1 Tax=Ningiella ruwaisensis TaxID=2364274 RepID=UPI00109F6797|nr:diguanylate cyclase [Ningiella ruwaisensis]
MELVADKIEQQHYRVLVVDDNELDLKLYANGLSKHFTMSFASSTDKAWELLNRAPLPDAIILDVMMSNEDGIDFCIRLKEQRYLSDIPVIFLSSLSGPSVRSQAFDSGGADFMAKPPVMAELVARLNRHIEQYHKTKRLESLIYIDPLTHLPNEAKFKEVLNQEWSRCARYWHHLSLIYIHVENLNEVKKNYGNDEYFAVSASLADDLCSVGARPGDLFASVGEDTFALLLSDCSIPGAALKARQIQQKFAHPHFMARHPHAAEHLTCTVAFSVAAPAGGSSANELQQVTESLLLNSLNVKAGEIYSTSTILGIDGILNNIKL